MAAGAAWGTLAHPEVAEINAKLTPFSIAASYSLTLLRYYNPVASEQQQRVKADNFADKFIAYLLRLYRPRLETQQGGEGGSAQLKALKTQLSYLFNHPEGKTLDDLAIRLDELLIFTKAQEEVD